MYIELKNVGPFKFCWILQISIFCKYNYRIGYCGKPEGNQIWQKVDFFLPKLSYIIHTIHHSYRLIYTLIFIHISLHCSTLFYFPFPPPPSLPLPRSPPPPPPPSSHPPCSLPPEFLQFCSLTRLWSVSVARASGDIQHSDWSVELLETPALEWQWTDCKLYPSALSGRRHYKIEVQTEQSVLDFEWV